MKLALHHFFILTAEADALAEAIAAIGLVEGPANDHPGQGTANRRFFLPNSTLEILYLRDAHEASNGRAAALRFAERVYDPHASPFGLIVHCTDQSHNEPFPGWRYHPEYLPDALFFHVGENTDSLEEPLCISMPPGLSAPDIPSKQKNSQWPLTELRISVPVTCPSAPLEAVSNCPCAVTCAFYRRYSRPSDVRTD